VGSPAEISFVHREDGTAIAYDVAGSGPPVIFLHGLTSNRRRWTPVTDLLIDSFTCIRLDARGHGESTKAGDYSVVTMASDVGAVAGELGIDAPAVVGNSLGGSTAAIFALTHSARAVVIIDQALRPSLFASRIRALENRLRGDGFVAAMMEFEEGLGIDPLPAPARAEIHAAVNSANADVVLGVWAQLFATADEELDRTMAAALSHLRARCLCVHGSAPGDDYVAWLTTHAPHAEIEIWEGMGHFLHLVDPARFADRLRTFLA
jgi:pimeloyl-ACP methyl ester carboxylesterase